MEKGPGRVSPFFIPMLIANMASGHIAIHFGAKGPNTCVVTACATGAHSIGDAFRAIQYGDAEAIIAGGTEANIAPLTVAGFNSMKALSTRNDAPEKASRPFEKNRDGFVVGEGAGILILEELEFALKRKARIYAELTGYGYTGDAYHMTAPSPDGDGAARCMRMAIKDAGLRPEDVDYINAHGTSTLPERSHGNHCDQVRVQGICERGAHQRHEIDDRSFAGRGWKHRGHLQRPVDL